MKRKPNNEWRRCIVCKEMVGPGEGMVVYPLPKAERMMLSAMTQAWTQGIRHRTCPLPIPKCECLDDHGTYENDDGVHCMGCGMPQDASSVPLIPDEV